MRTARTAVALSSLLLLAAESSHHHNWPTAYVQSPTSLPTSTVTPSSTPTTTPVTATGVEQGGWKWMHRFDPTSTVTAIGTLLMAIATFFMARATKRYAEAAEAPVVTPFRFDCHRDDKQRTLVIAVIFRNSGGGAAYNTFVWADPWFADGQPPAPKISAEHLFIMAPAQEVTVPFLTPIDGPLYDSIEKEQSILRVSTYCQYESINKKQYEHDLDFQYSFLANAMFPTAKKH